MRINADQIVSITAIIVSIGTLFMIIYQTNLVRREQKASVMPYLNIGISLNDSYQAIHISNKGLGPAMIESVQLIVNDSIINTEPYDYAQQILADKFDSLQVNEANVVYKGRLIAPNEGITILSHLTKGKYHDFILKNFLFSFDILYKDIENTDNYAIVKITYSSVYGEKWSIRSDESIPKSLND